jgi:hypothetical protein
MQISTPEWPVMRGDGCCRHFVCGPNIRAEKLKIREIGLFYDGGPYRLRSVGASTSEQVYFEVSDLNHQVRK